MVRGRSKDWVQIKRGDAKLLQIVQMIDNPQQIAPLKALRFGWGAPRFELNAAWLWRARAAGETVGKNLVKDGAFRPNRVFEWT